MKKSQIAMEFLMMVALATAVIIILISGLYYLTFNYSEDKIIRGLQDLGYSLQNELILAAEVEPGYERTITIPDNINGAVYSISQNNKYLVLEYKSTQLTFPIPTITSGVLVKGSNIIIQNANGEVVIT